MLIGVDASRATVACRTGTEFYSLRLIEALLELDTAHRFRLYFNRPPKKPGFFVQPMVALNRVSGSPRVELRTIPLPRLWTHIRLGLEVATHPPDVLFVPSHVLPLWTRPPGVVTVHDLGYLHFPEAHPPRQRWYLDWSTRHNVRTARVVIADSEATKHDIGVHYGVPLSKIVVAYPGFDPAPLDRADSTERSTARPSLTADGRPPKSERSRRRPAAGPGQGLTPITDVSIIAAVKRRYGIQGDYFLHIGTLQPRKNLARLIQAFANLLPNLGRSQIALAGQQSSSPNAEGHQAPSFALAGSARGGSLEASNFKVRLVLAGKKGWLYDDLFRQVHHLGLEGRVLFPGYVDEADKAALLSGALAYVFPSLYEGFGFPALEAQACDTPLICAASSSLPEVTGDAALLVDPMDVDGLTQAMARLLGDVALRADLVARGRRNRERFSWRACAETVMTALEAVVKGDGGRRTNDE